MSTGIKHVESLNFAGSQAAMYADEPVEVSLSFVHHGWVRYRCLYWPAAQPWGLANRRYFKPIGPVARKILKLAGEWKP